VLPNFFSATEALIPEMRTRLQPVIDLGVAVQGLPDGRADAGFVASNSVTLAWIAYSPIQGQGNSVSGLTTQTLTLNARISANSLTLRNQVADLLYQRLTGWSLTGVTGLAGCFLSWGGAEIIPPAENDADYRMDVRFGLVIQSRPPR
jgi:hypothetical protein